MTKGYRFYDNWSYVLDASNMDSIGNTVFGSASTSINVGASMADKLKDATALEPYLATLVRPVVGELEIVEIVAANGTTGVLTLVRGVQDSGFSFNCEVGNKLEIRVPSMLLRAISSGERLLSNGSEVLFGRYDDILYF